MKVEHCEPRAHGGQSRCHRCGLTVGYRDHLVVVTDPVEATRYYHLSCWDFFALSSPAPDAAGVAAELRELAGELAVALDAEHLSDEVDRVEDVMIRLRAAAARLAGTEPQ